MIQLIVSTQLLLGIILLNFNVEVRCVKILIKCFMYSLIGDICFGEVMCKDTK